MTYREAMAYLEGCNQYLGEFSLEPLRELLGRMGNPQDSLRFVHIAGTNGKGSVLAFVSTILKEAGYRVGRYISPTIREYRERIQVNGEYIPEADLARLTERLKTAGDRLLAEGKRHPTMFEMETALSFLYFREKGCDIVVLETGRGGRTDATNVISAAEAAVLTPISMDHMDFLGNTLTEIAGHKAGIIEKGCAVVTARQRPEAMAVIEAEARAKGCPLTVADDSLATNRRRGLSSQVFDYPGWPDAEISLSGEYQFANAALALETVGALREKGWIIPDHAVRAGLKNTVWEGRFALIARNPDFIVDGAHNRDAAEKLKESISLYLPGRRIIMICGVLKDKEYDWEMRLLAPLSAAVITVQTPGNPRALPAAELAETVRRYNPNVRAAGSLAEAVEMACAQAGADDVIVAFGSLSYLGELMECVKKTAEARQAGRGEMPIREE